jgi:IclR family transcriptional regulator, acetate operon repressor
LGSTRICACSTATATASMPHRRATPGPAASAPTATSPVGRQFAVLELLGANEHGLPLPALVQLTGWPKASLHRMLQGLEAEGLAQRSEDGRGYQAGQRLRRLADTVLMHSVHHSARRAVLRHLVHTLGESCNLTALNHGEVVYLDRVETAAPLRFALQAGSRVPLHCSASGKVFLSQMDAADRQRLLGTAPLQAHTPHTLTKKAALHAELEQAARQGHALDREEFLQGLLCVAVPVPHPSGRSRLCLAVQAPVMRLPPARASRVLPALRRAAAALASLEHREDAS